jgi:predicted nucleotidyltransferase
MPTRASSSKPAGQPAAAAVYAYILVSMANLDEVLRTLREQAPRLQALGVLRLGVFGSVARGESHAGSDLDLLVQLDRLTFDRYMDLKIFLEDLFQCPIDLVPEQNLDPRLREAVYRELIHAA